MLGAMVPAGRSSRTRVLGQAVRLLAGLALAVLMGWSMAGRRGPVFGILAFGVYGALLFPAALSFSGLKRWSADHVLLDSLMIVPLSFFALLLIPVLPWWGAALLAVGVGAVLVPIGVRRRTAARRSPGPVGERR